LPDTAAHRRWFGQEDASESREERCKRLGCIEPLAETRCKRVGCVEPLAETRCKRVGSVEPLAETLCMRFGRFSEVRPERAREAANG
jgi:hypothetical protein